LTWGPRARVKETKAAILAMEFAEVERKLKAAIECFRSNDMDLMDFDNLKLRLPERPISHRLGFYMQVLFSNYNVDCEYNKHLEGVKEADGNPVIPDVVVHKRKVDDSNLLAVEVKARRNQEEADRDQEEIGEDYEQLKKYTRQNGDLKYTYGAFVLFLLDSTTIKWFENGAPRVESA
jgi:hypothetical protein